jgi:Na+-driven multidrug efflux pump
VRIVVREMGVDFGILGKIVRVGIPAALQMAITAFSNVFVQSYINGFGEDGMSGWTAYTKIDQLVLLPMQSVALSSTTFVAQNLGGDKVERAKRGVRMALLLGIGSTVVLMLPVMLFAPGLVSFFNGKAEVIEIGSYALRIQCTFLMALPVSVVATMLFQSIGKSLPALVISCLQSGLIFIPLCILLTRFRGIIGIQWSQPLAYLASSMVSLPMLIIFLKKLPPDGEEPPKFCALEYVHLKLAVALCKHNSRARHSRPNDMTSCRQQTAKYNIFKYTAEISAENESIACRLKCGKACADSRAYENTVKYVL